MARLVMPDKHCRSVDVAGRRYEPPAGSASVEPANRAHEKALRDAGCFPANLGGRVDTTGYPCACGHGSLFRICGKCGKDNG